MGQPVYRVYFRRKGGSTWGPANVLLVTGKDELERILGRKTPIAVAWEKAKLYSCSACDRRGPWDKGWSARGRWEGGQYTDVEVACSRECIERLGPHEDRRHWHDWEPLSPTERAKRKTVGMSESDRAALTRARRTVPLPRRPKNAERPCGWCTKEITGPYAHLRSWHPDCKRIWLLHYDRDAQARFLIDRDGYDCWDCRRGGRWWRLDLVVPRFAWQGRPHCMPGPKTEAQWQEKFPFAGQKVNGVIVGIFSAIEWRPHCGSLEVDHEIPLWSIWHLPDDERRRFYGPENIRLRCNTCHKDKSKREAAERAALRTKGPVELT